MGFNTVILKINLTVVRAQVVQIGKCLPWKIFFPLLQGDVGDFGALRLYFILSVF